MKKLFLLALCLTLFINLSCFLDEDDDETAPAGDGVLSVTVNYDTSLFGETDPDPDKAGTTNLFVYLYETQPTDSRTPTPVKTGSTETNGGTIEFTEVPEGDYYILAFYDYRSGDNNDNQGDRYILYDNTNDPANATALHIDANTTPITMSFDDTYQLQKQSAFDI